MHSPSLSHQLRVVSEGEHSNSAMASLTAETYDNSFIAKTHHLASSSVPLADMQTGNDDTMATRNTSFGGNAPDKAPSAFFPQQEFDCQNSSSTGMGPEGEGSGISVYEVASSRELSFQQHQRTAISSTKIRGAGKRSSGSSSFSKGRQSPNDLASSLSSSASVSSGAPVVMACGGPSSFPSSTTMATSPNTSYRHRCRKRNSAGGSRKLHQNLIIPPTIAPPRHAGESKEPGIRRNGLEDDGLGNFSSLHLHSLNQQYYGFEHNRNCSSFSARGAPHLFSSTSSATTQVNTPNWRSSSSGLGGIPLAPPVTNSFLESGDSSACSSSIPNSAPYSSSFPALSNSSSAVSRSLFQTLPDNVARLATQPPMLGGGGTLNGSPKEYPEGRRSLLQNLPHHFADSHNKSRTNFDAPDCPHPLLSHHSLFDLRDSLAALEEQEAHLQANTLAPHHPPYVPPNKSRHSHHPQHHNFHPSPQYGFNKPHPPFYGRDMIPFSSNSPNSVVPINFPIPPPPPPHSPSVVMGNNNVIRKSPFVPANPSFSEGVFPSSSCNTRHCSRDHFLSNRSGGGPPFFGAHAAPTSVVSRAENGEILDSSLLALTNPSMPSSAAYAFSLETYTGDILCDPSSAEDSTTSCTSHTTAMGLLQNCLSSQKQRFGQGFYSSSRSRLSLTHDPRLLSDCNDTLTNLPNKVPPPMQEGERDEVKQKNVRKFPHMNHLSVEGTAGRGGGWEADAPLLPYNFRNRSYNARPPGDANIRPSNVQSVNPSSISLSQFSHYSRSPFEAASLESWPPPFARAGQLTGSSIGTNDEGAEDDPETIPAAEDEVISNEPLSVVAKQRMLKNSQPDSLFLKDRKTKESTVFSSVNGAVTNATSDVLFSQYVKEEQERAAEGKPRKESSSSSSLSSSLSRCKALLPLPFEESHSLKDEQKKGLDAAEMIRRLSLDCSGFATTAPAFEDDNKSSSCDDRSRGRGFSEAGCGDYQRVASFQNTPTTPATDSGSSESLSSSIVTGTSDDFMKKTQSTGSGAVSDSVHLLSLIRTALYRQQQTSVDSSALQLSAQSASAFLASCANTNLSVRQVESNSATNSLSESCTSASLTSSVPPSSASYDSSTSSGSSLPPSGQLSPKHCEPSPNRFLNIPCIPHRRTQHNTMLNYPPLASLANSRPSLSSSSALESLAPAAVTDSDARSYQTPFGSPDSVEVPNPQTSSNGGNSPTSSTYTTTSSSIFLEPSSSIRLTDFLLWRSLVPSLTDNVSPAYTPVADACLQYSPHNLEGGTNSNRSSSAGDRNSLDISRGFSSPAENSMKSSVCERIHLGQRRENGGEFARGYEAEQLEAKRKISEASVASSICCRLPASRITPSPTSSRKPQGSQTNVASMERNGENRKQSFLHCSEDANGDERGNSAVLPRAEGTQGESLSFAQLSVGDALRSCTSLLYDTAIEGGDDSPSASMFCTPEASFTPIHSSMYIPQVISNESRSSTSDSNDVNRFDTGTTAATTQFAHMDENLECERSNTPTCWTVPHSASAGSSSYSGDALTTHIKKTLFEGGRRKEKFPFVSDVPISLPRSRSHDDVLPTLRATTNISRSGPSALPTHSLHLSSAPASPTLSPINPNHLSSSPTECFHKELFSCEAFEQKLEGIRCANDRSTGFISSASSSSKARKAATPTASSAPSADDHAKDVSEQRRLTLMKTSSGRKSLPPPPPPSASTSLGWMNEMGESSSCNYAVNRGDWASSPNPVRPSSSSRIPRSCLLDHPVLASIARHVHMENLEHSMAQSSLSLSNAPISPILSAHEVASHISPFDALTGLTNSKQCASRKIGEKSSADCEERNEKTLLLTNGSSTSSASPTAILHSLLVEGARHRNNGKTDSRGLSPFRTTNSSSSCSQFGFSAYPPGIRQSALSANDLQRHGSDQQDIPQRHVITPQAPSKSLITSMTATSKSQIAPTDSERPPPPSPPPPESPPPPPPLSLTYDGKVPSGSGGHGVRPLFIDLTASAARSVHASVSTPSRMNSHLFLSKKHSERSCPISSGTTSDFFSGSRSSTGKRALLPPPASSPSLLSHVTSPRGASTSFSTSSALLPISANIRSPSPLNSNTDGSSSPASGEYDDAQQEGWDECNPFPSSIRLDMWKDSSGTPLQWIRYLNSRGHLVWYNPRSRTVITVPPPHYSSPEERGYGNCFVPSNLTSSGLLQKSIHASPSPCGNPSTEAHQERRDTRGSASISSTAASSLTSLSGVLRPNDFQSKLPELWEETDRISGESGKKKKWIRCLTAYGDLLYKNCIPSFPVYQRTRPVDFEEIRDSSDHNSSPTSAVRTVPPKTSPSLPSPSQLIENGVSIALSTIAVCLAICAAGVVLNPSIVQYLHGYYAALDRAKDGTSAVPLPWYDNYQNEFEPSAFTSTPFVDTANDNPIYTTLSFCSSVTRSPEKDDNLEKGWGLQGKNDALGSQNISSQSATSPVSSDHRQAEATDTLEDILSFSGERNDTSCASPSHDAYRVSSSREPSADAANSVGCSVPERPKAQQMLTEKQKEENMSSQISEKICDVKILQPEFVNADSEGKMGIARVTSQTMMATSAFCSASSATPHITAVTSSSTSTTMSTEDDDASHAVCRTISDIETTQQPEACLMHLSERGERLMEDFAADKKGENREFSPTWGGGPLRPDAKELSSVTKTTKRANNDNRTFQLTSTTSNLQEETDCQLTKNTVGEFLPFSEGSALQLLKTNRISSSEISAEARQQHNTAKTELFCVLKTLTFWGLVDEETSSVLCQWVGKTHPTELLGAEAHELRVFMDQVKNVWITDWLKQDPMLRGKMEPLKPLISRRLRQILYPLLSRKPMLDINDNRQGSGDGK